jgi:electron transfer flavoprotein alpha subunit
MEKIIIVVETKGDAVRKVSLELLGEGRKLAESGRFEVEALVLGNVSAYVREKLLPWAAKVINLTNAVLDTYTPEGYSQAVAAYAREAAPKIVLAGATRTGRDFMPRTAVLLDAGIASDVTAATWSNDPITFIRPMYGGKVLSEVSFAGYPALVTVRPNTFETVQPGDEAGEWIEKSVDLRPDKVRTKVLRVEEAVKGKVDLTEADVIVAGGRGMKAAENFRLLEDLAGAIGATVGATRSVVDAKWRDQEDQVGKSGKTVSPKLYIAAGISGAIHHIMGMDTSKVVLVINKDPNAIIYSYADYGIVGDALEVLPAMTEEFKKRMGK